MLANFLSKSKPINFIGLLILFFVSFSYALYNSFLVESSFSDNLLKIVILSVLFLIIFFFFNFVNSKNRLTFDNSYAYFLFSVFTIALLSEIINYNILLKTTIYLLFLRKIYSLRSNRNIIEKLFDGGFWLGILCILEPISILLFVLTFIAVYLHNKITVHTLFTPIIGFISPLIIYFTYCFWFDKVDEFMNLFVLNIHFNADFYNNPKYLWVICITFSFTVFAIIFKSAKALSVNNRFKRNWIILISNFFLTLVFIALIQNKNGSELIYIFFPMAIILANGVELIQKKIFKNVVLYMLLFGSLFVHFFL
jgi:hypothetical protein